MRNNPKELGDLTESLVIWRLLQAGFSVSIPFGDNDKYDLIVDDDGSLFRVQCKTAWYTGNGTIRFNTHSQTTKHGEYHEVTYHGSIDAFLVRKPRNETLYWIPIERATTQKMELRFESDIDHPSINWAEDFEFNDSIPT